MKGEMRKVRTPHKINILTHQRCIIHKGITGGKKKDKVRKAEEKGGRGKRHQGVE